MKVLSVVGARPQFVKLGPLSRILRKRHSEIIVHTGQHYDHQMSDLFFSQLEIPNPDINLEIGSGTHAFQTSRMLQGLENQILTFKPDVVITFGDTNSTLAACLAAAKLCVPSIHIEAGLRSFNRSMPEEINRIVSDHTADLLFAPTQEAMIHLKREGLEKRAILTGDIMVDSIAFVQNKLGADKNSDQPFMLLTLHRPYNVDDPERLSKILQSLGDMAEIIIFPAHPRTKLIIEQFSIPIPSNFIIIPPQGYIEFQRLLKNCLKVITDSGGLQKESYISGKPCITLRPETEWTETVEAGWNLLLESDDPDLSEKITAFDPVRLRPDLYGRNIAVKMVNEIEYWYDIYRSN